jgi:hypothetical protein
MERGMELRLVAERPIHSVHDGADASVNTKPVLLQAPSVVFEFSKAFNTRKIADKNRRELRVRLTMRLAPRHQRT